MSERLLVFTAQAVSVDAAGYPPGGRHAQSIFARAADVEDARALAVGRVEGAGWTAVTLLRATELVGGQGSIADDTLRAAAASAFGAGCGFVVYADPLPYDA